MSQATMSAAGMRIIKLLVGAPPQTVADLIKATDVTRTAVTEQLNDLITSGFVERTTERLPGRGRPRHLYKATNATLLLLFANSQRLVVPAIWRAIAQVGGSKLTRKVLDHVSETLADHYRDRVTSEDPEERLCEMIELLRKEGGLVEVEEDEAGHVVVHKRSCPFISMYEETGTVCCVDQETMSAVVGAPVIRTACRHDGDPCCTFEIAPSDKG